VFDVDFNLNNNIEEVFKNNIGTRKILNQTLSKIVINKRLSKINSQTKNLNEERLKLIFDKVHMMMLEIFVFPKLMSKIC